MNPAISSPDPLTRLVDFDNLEVAFAGRSDADLTRAYWLFKAMSSNLLVNNGPVLLDVALKLQLPVIPVIRATIYKHFCGGESIADCNKTIAALKKKGIGSVLDYSVEGAESEENFEHTTAEIIATILRAKGDTAIPFCVFKITGVARMEILEKAGSGNILSATEKNEYDQVWLRVNKICAAAAENDVRIFIDAEDSWIQQAIDDMAEAMMQKYNSKKAIVYNTIQLYRTDRLEFLKLSHQKSEAGNYILGLKLVRGAYMEKERARAAEKNYPSPIQPNHAATNRDYDAALTYCIEHFGAIAVCAGTHNEASSHLLVQLMYAKNIPHNHPDIWFSQLLGMSDHISSNLAAAGYNVAKYVPYGPVKSVLPYLIRRAQENTSIAGQTGRELKMIVAEKKRRKK
ncbi:MAG: proline dehydrogenase family protein [Bacteroidota bacterium]|nr:proline dehydrogenase family protein [Bacteroidota bacterium]